MTVVVRPMVYKPATPEQIRKMDEIMDRDRAKRVGYWLMVDGILTFIETRPALVREKKGISKPGARND